jgi:hypothetical protein
MTTTQKSMKAKEVNNTSHDAAIVSMETHTLMNGT